ncbi:MAG: hypothetical protein HYS77_10765 [Candidatus Rokubacteria bacterium]|nr:hypothetical protein [Candidatus Rokubacteria bacterium]
MPPRVVAVVGMVVAALAGCAGARIEAGVFHSDKGYRVTLPAAGWTVDGDGAADLVLRRSAGPAAILAHAECGRAGGRTLDVLARHLLLGVRDRITLERGAASVGGRPALRAVLDGRVGPGDAATRIETYVVKDGRCVYDLVYVAPPAAFETGRGDFRRLVESFATESR